MKRWCERCYFVEILEAKSCIMMYVPDISGLEAEEAADRLNHFVGWKKKMLEKLLRIRDEVRKGGVFHHPCSGCPEWSG